VEIDTKIQQKPTQSESEKSYMITLKNLPEGVDDASL
jgi:hypothetical protein